MTAHGLYTILLEYAGGTYVAQVEATSPITALSAWISKRSDTELAPWGIKRTDLSEIVTSDSPIAIDGCVNVWCITGSAPKGLLLIDIVATDTSAIA
jgi:hypothetical protein